MPTRRFRALPQVGWGDQAMVCREHDALSAYLLGALEPAERTAVERHVAHCVRCQAELVQLAPLVGLLRHTPFEELSDTAAARAQHPTMPNPRSIGVAPIGASPTGAGAFAFTGRRLRRPGRVLTAAAVAVATAGAGLGVYLGTVASGPASHPPALTVSATSPATRISASATLTPNQSGTAIQLQLAGLPPAITCHLVVHARDGRTETAATWASGYSTAVSIPASTSIGPQDISTLDVLDSSGRLLVQIPQT